MQLPSGAVALIEAGRPLPDAPPQQTAPADAGASSTAEGAVPAVQEQPAAAAAAAASDADPGAGVHPTDAATLSGHDVPAPAEAPAAAPATQDPDAASAHSSSSLLTVAASGVVLGDLLGGKAVLHVVDRVLISPGLSRELGLLPSPGYTVLDPPPPPAASSGAQQVSPPASAGWVLSMALAMWLCLL